ncbi:MAG TPA: metallophosphoesterase [Deltaproteobacteria bacterium]|nr:metallophosphoesterase [Deltaproteobacteria bacterium]HQI80859.1 metallophosphoesterase [Deltaproteobacteria bacterium]
MKRIGVISDTHLNGPDDRLETLALNYFADVDLIVHAGDMVHCSVLDVFLALGRDVVAVCGNMDGYDVRASYPVQRIIEVEGVTLGIMHGWGAPSGIRRRIREALPRVDAIVYGHTHEGFAAFDAGVFFFNPGSPMESRFTSTRSIGIMTVKGTTITGDIIPV